MCKSHWKSSHEEVSACKGKQLRTMELVVDIYNEISAVLMVIVITLLSQFALLAQKSARKYSATRHECRWMFTENKADETFYYISLLDGLVSNTNTLYTPGNILHLEYKGETMLAWGNKNFMPWVSIVSPYSKWKIFPGVYVCCSLVLYLTVIH